MITFEHNNTKYQEIDFDNQFTAEQEDVYSEIKSKVDKVFTSALQNLDKLQDSDNPVEVLKAVDLCLDGLDSKTVCKLLAHTYLEVDEEVFDKDKYDKRVDMFFKMPLKKRRPLQKAIPKYLGDIRNYTVEDIQTYFPTLKPQTQQ